MESAAGVVTIGIAQNRRKWGENEWASMARSLPPQLREMALVFHRWEDRQASLLGKLLLTTCLRASGHDTNLIGTIQWDAYKRPFLAGSIDFNIAHSDGAVVCALVQNGRVGIDIEAIKPIDVADYKSVFTAREYGAIVQSPDPVTVFFELWTRKEAVIKADGRGFYVDPKTVDVSSNAVQLAGDVWRTEKLAIAEDYVCHLALPAETNTSFQLLYMDDWSV